MSRRGELLAKRTCLGEVGDSDSHWGVRGAYALWTWRVRVERALNGQTDLPHAHP
jgi:hypothetical protein